MLRAVIVSLALILGNDAASVKPAAPPTTSDNAAAVADKSADTTENSVRATTDTARDADPPAVSPSAEFDARAEEQLLQLANQARAQAGVPKLAMDAGLRQAARMHADAMYRARQLSHQFDGESSLPLRLAATTSLMLDREAENVALDSSAENAAHNLMLSLPHRENLLNPAYNIAGMGVVRSGERLYIVQDFGHALPNDSVDDVKDRVAAAVARTRRRANQSELQRTDDTTLNDAACSMAQADRLSTAAVHQLAQRSTILTYTSIHPETLPANGLHAISGHNLHRFGIGACYARTDTYPSGVYWVVLALE